MAKSNFLPHDNTLVIFTIVPLNDCRYSFRTNISTQLDSMSRFCATSPRTALPKPIFTIYWDSIPINFSRNS
ncbi:hypothetical protein V1477_003481 [Vespula maculifrons]|uniref:Uncharacterized protein n=1 Tax=Vespula maculifrons TaxID=7453 RepID=A0ABD2CSU4_VESMC